MTGAELELAQGELAEEAEELRRLVLEAHVNGAEAVTKNALARAFNVIAYLATSREALERMLDEEVLREVLERRCA